MLLTVGIADMYVRPLNMVSSVELLIMMSSRHFDRYILTYVLLVLGKVKVKVMMTAGPVYSLFCYRHLSQLNLKIS